MLHLTLNELDELKDSIVTLEDVLRALDRIGAGIAAIHVDAAINQLKNNLEIVAEDIGCADFDLEGCPSEQRLSSR